jgi:hypothetical protein
MVGSFYDSNVGHCGVMAIMPHKFPNTSSGRVSGTEKSRSCSIVQNRIDTYVMYDRRNCSRRIFSSFSLFFCPSVIHSMKYFFHYYHYFTH